MIRFIYTTFLLAALASSAFADDLPPKYTLGIQVGNYTPNIDSQFEQSAGSVLPPYQSAFGGDPSLLFNVSIHRNIPTPIGTTSIGVSAGYWCKEGKAIAPAGSDASDTTEMVIYPLQLQGSYRLDRWLDYVPLAPVARVGLSYSYWRIYDGADNVAEFAPGQRATGGTLGWHATVGVHLLLDALDPEAAIDFERDAGLMNTYFTVEYQYSRVDDFGSADSFRMGDEILMFGLALDF
ncbi:MAG: MXAN_2562 family outer membrane beta-barrel protein [Myxococcota bacterium]|nr:MXAN_2562 family outer membrane beta-barrel protein [Myxococcota bacterium]